MSKTSAPYGLSLFEYKGSNFSGTNATYPINPTASVVGVDQTGITGPNAVVGLCAGDLVTFGLASAAANPVGVNWVVNAPSTGYIVAANSLYYITTAANLNNPRAILGVFGGVQYLNPQNQNIRGTYWANTTTNNVYPGTYPVATVNDLPDCIFQVQCNGPLGVTQGAAQAQVGKLCGFANNASGNTSTGQSQLQLDVGTITTGPTGLVTGIYPSSPATFAVGVCQTQWAPFRLIGLAPIQGNSWTDPYPDVLVMINNHMWKPGQPA